MSAPAKLLTVIPYHTMGLADEQTLRTKSRLPLWYQPKLQAVPVRQSHTDVKLRGYICCRSQKLGKRLASEINVEASRRTANSPDVYTLGGCFRSTVLPQSLSTQWCFQGAQSLFMAETLTCEILHEVSFRI